MHLSLNDYNYRNILCHLSTPCGLKFVQFTLSFEKSRTIEKMAEGKKSFFFSYFTFFLLFPCDNFFFLVFVQMTKKKVFFYKFYFKF